MVSVSVTYHHSHVADAESRLPAGPVSWGRLTTSHWLEMRSKCRYNFYWMLMTSAPSYSWKKRLNHWKLGTVCILEQAMRGLREVLPSSLNYRSALKFPGEDFWLHAWTLPGILYQRAVLTIVIQGPESLLETERTGPGLTMWLISGDQSVWAESEILIKLTPFRLGG